MESKQNPLLLFAYGSLMRDEPDHHALGESPALGQGRTAPGYRLIELQGFPCMIATGNRQVEGELYEIDFEVQRTLDLLKENTRLFHRRVIQLESGKQAVTYLMNEDQVRGRRRLPADSWRERFAPTVGRLRR